MLFVNSKYLTIFDVVIYKKYKRVSCTISSSSRYIKDDKIEYENMYWDCQFVGDCFEKATELNDKDKIDIKKGIIVHKDNKYVVKIFDFEMSDLSKPNIDEQMKEIENIDDKELIFTE